MPGPHPADGRPPATPLGTVVRLAGRRRGRHADDQPPTPRRPAPDERDIEFAAAVQALAHRSGCTLTDADTAAGYRIGLETARLLHNAAAATGQISAVQRELLSSMLDSGARVTETL